MGGFNREALKTTSAAAMDKQKREQEQKRPSGFVKGSNHKIDEGINLFRFYPFHPDDNVPEDEQRYAEAKCVSFLKVEKDKRDPDTNRIIEGEKEIRNSPIFNARVHGNLSNDPVEAYMKFAKEVAIPNFTGDKKTQDKIWSIITGYNGPDGKFVSGIKPGDTWVLYADKFIDGEWKIGTLDIKKTTKEALQALALTVTEGETPDPYTNADDGYVVVLTKTGRGKDTKVTPSIQEKKIDKVNAQKVILPLTDDQLDYWFKLPSLRKMFVNSYTQKDWDFQMEGLQRFEAELVTRGFAINVFGYEEFLDTLEQLANELPEPTVAETATEKKAEVKKTPAPVAKVVTAPKIEVKKPVVVTPPVATRVPIKKVTPPVVEESSLEEQLFEEQEGSTEAVEETQVVQTSSTKSGLSRLEQIRLKHKHP